MPGWGHAVAVGISGSQRQNRGAQDVQGVPVMGSAPGCVQKDRHNDPSVPHLSPAAHLLCLFQGRFLVKVLCSALCRGCRVSVRGSLQL